MRCLRRFRNRYLENYGLCPNYYLSGPALNWDGMRSMSKVELDLISDVDMFFEKGMREGVSYILKDTAKQIAKI